RRVQDPAACPGDGAPARGAGRPAPRGAWRALHRSQERSAPGRGTVGMNILVVDDEPAVRFSLVELLEAAGHAVRAVEHAPAALEALESEPADLVLSDLRMPALDGLALLAEVRARHPTTVFVLMTAYGDERTAVAALREGAY